MTNGTRASQHRNVAGLTCIYVDQVRTVYGVEVRRKSYKTVDGATSPIHCLCPFNANILARKAKDFLVLLYVCLHANTSSVTCSLNFCQDCNVDLEYPESACTSASLFEQ